MKMQQLLFVSISMVIVVGLSAFAYAAKPTSPVFVTTAPGVALDAFDANCPARACTIVVKTERDGPPSAQIDVR
ncbi:MAG: hypothetical protein P4L98_19675 [Ancalomicrobiaceae bacterium]|nr:hypothetical protein [Ancalomicrobiaceae bacterium]